MDARVLRCLAAAAALGAALPGYAEGASAARCRIPAARENPLADRAGTLAQYERLPQSCLHQIFSACQDAASTSLMDFGSAAVCSFGYEALLRQQFGGNFGELLAWWRAQRPSAAQ